MAQNGGSRKQQRAVRVAGVMTGTSCDGLDLACVEFAGPAEGPEWRALWSATAPYPVALRRRVLGAQKPGFEASAREWLELNRDLGEWYARTIARLIARRAPRPDLIANHGQTLAHFPDRRVTMQMGDPALIARATGLTVACSFRDGDVAAGGQGAPLVPRFHALMARKIVGADRGRGIAIHNLGGISNLTYLGPRDLTLAFDTGPANAWIDAAASRATRGRQSMDTGGRLARAGHADLRAVQAALSHPFFRRHAPKSTGRDDFPFEILLELTRARGADLVATATAVTIASVSRAYEREILGRGLPLARVLFCGGGAKNPSIIEGVRDWLAAASPRVSVGTLADSQLIEAQAFAYLGYLSLHGHAVGGAWTGARGIAPPAHLVPGANWSGLRSKALGSRSRR
jgi:anhydro-N-acetylmuramic acid kinase